MTSRSPAVRTVERLIPRSPEELHGLRRLSPLGDAFLAILAVLGVVVWLVK